MSNFPLNKEQNAAKTTIDKNVAVSAGAGSGKTRVLVERFLYILEQERLRQRPANALNKSLSEQEAAIGEERSQQFDATNILAITFTRKAAGEMKERVRKGIMEKLSAAISYADKEFWRGQLDALERAQISTMHTLCSRILRENPVEAQLDPAFQVAEGFDSKQFTEECLDSFLRRTISNPKDAVYADLKKLLDEYGVYDLRTQLLDILKNTEQLIAKQATLEQSYEDSLKDLQNKKVELCNLLNSNIRPPKPKKGKVTATEKAIAQLATHLQAVCAEIKETPANLIQLSFYLDKMRASSGKEYIKAMKLLRDALSREPADKKILAEHLVPTWVRVISAVQEELNARKREQDVLGFDDLERWTVRLLKEHESVRRKYQQRYQYIMVDEFQDTNDLQRQLVYWLCGDSVEALQGQKLFVVGDPKQSIYRFRGADVGTFARVRHDIVQGGGVEIKLNINYRSADKILDAVNEKFATLMGTDASEPVYFEPLQADPKNSSEQKPEFVRVIYSSENEEKESEAEAKALARIIKNAHEGKNSQGELLKLGAIPYGRMAILLRALTHSAEVESALQEQGIPYELIDGRGFYERQEILDIYNLLQVLSDSFNDVALAGVLRSPYFGLNDETLTRLFAIKSSCLWEALEQAQVQEQQSLLERARRLLGELRREAAHMALPELWDSLWRRLGVEAVLMRQEHGVNKLANVQKLRLLAQQYSFAKGGELRDWLRYIATWRENDERETTANVPAEDKVQIMSIHKSKGLEFHTVFLPYLGGRLNGDKDSIKYSQELGLGIQAADVYGVMQESSVLHSIKERNKELEQEERMRLLYVAMTRAERYLVMTAVVKKPDDKIDVTINELKEKNWREQLLAIITDAGTQAVQDGDKYFFDAAEVHDLDMEEEQDASVSGEALSNEVQTLHGSAAAAVSPEQEALMQPLTSYQESGRRFFSPSMLQQYLYCQRQFFYRNVACLPSLEEDNSASGASISAKLKGTILHCALELYQGDAQKALQASLKGLVQEYDDESLQSEMDNARGLLWKLLQQNKLNTEYAALLELLENYVASPLYKSLPTKQWRELKFNLAEGELQLGGIVDLLCENNGELQIVDYKTGQPPKAATPNLGYIYQLAIYKHAMEQRFGKAVRSVALHFLQNLQDYSLPADKDYYQEAVELCREIYLKYREEDFACSVDVCAYCPYNYLCTKK